MIKDIQMFVGGGHVYLFIGEYNVSFSWNGSSSEQVRLEEVQ